MKTLADIAREHSVTPQAVAKWRDKAIEEHGDLPYQPDGNRKLYDDNSVEKILQFKPEQTTAIPTETEIFTGNHRVTGQLANLPSTIDLGSMRNGTNLTVFNNDALVAVDQALDLADQMLEAIEDDTDFQLSQLNKTQRANNQLKRKVDKLRTRQQQYVIESRLIGLAQGKEATELQQTMQEIQNLGNPEG
ncbi:MAG: hypothetical protein ACFB2W_14265 [Leptolyngbyaceae cyanobacterium]